MGGVAPAEKVVVAGSVAAEGMPEVSDWIGIPVPTATGADVDVPRALADVLARELTGKDGADCVEVVDEEDEEDEEEEAAKTLFWRLWCIRA